MCKHLGQCLTLDRHSVQRPVCYFQWKTGLCQTLELRTEHQGIPMWSVCLHFGNWAKEAVSCSALITGMPPPCPDSLGLGIWKREVSADSHSGRKILSRCAAAELIQTLAPILRALSEVKLVICSVCMSFSGHWLWGLCFIIIALLLEMTSPSRGGAVTYSGISLQIRLPNTSGGCGPVSPLSGSSCGRPQNPAGTPGAGSSSDCLHLLSMCW